MTWIKMRVDLDTDPAVIGVSESLDLPPEHVIGCLWKLWSWANLQTIDGCANSDGARVTEKWIDRHVSVAGFADALAKVGWLTITSEGISIPNFERHNGKSAKDRALAANRMETLRQKTLRNSYARSATSASPEKRREDKRERERTHFTKPTIEDVKAYFQEQKLKSDPEQFFDYYEAAGWKKSGRVITHWKPAARNWERHEKVFHGHTHNNRTANRPSLAERIAASRKDPC
jgi:hypothetical protein